MTKRDHVIIPDGQVKMGVSLDHWLAIGRYLAETRPDVIVNIGDFADMPSLSSYDEGTMGFEGRRYIKDIVSVITAQKLLLSPIWEHNEVRKRTKHKLYRPRMEFCLGNHENRINKAIQKDAKLDGLISTDDLKYRDFGWNVNEFLEVVDVDGIHYSHYFVSGMMGRPATTAQAVLRNECRSSVMGHSQRIELAWHTKRNFFALFAGICYEHQEEYLGPQGNSLVPGIWHLHNVDGNGSAEPQFISLKTLKEQYL